VGVSVRKHAGETSYAHAVTEAWFYEVDAPSPTKSIAPKRQ